MKKINKKILLFSSIAILMIATGVTSYALINQPKKDVATTVNNSQPEVEKISEVAPAVTVETQTISQPEAPVPQPTPAPAPAVPVQKPSYKWAAEMAAAGIAESDYGYVSEMVLTDDGWKLFGEKVWQGAHRAGVDCKKDLTACIARADRWVKEYHGSWGAANALWKRAGNF